MGRIGILSFKKGIHLEDYKEYSRSEAIEYPPLPDEVFIPLQQHTGAPNLPIINRGDTVKTGQLIGGSDQFVSSPVHSSITGKVKTIDSFWHPVGVKVQMIHIERTGDDEWDFLSIPDNWQKEPVKNLKKLIWEAGIVGLGGAAFPTHVKLSPPKEKPIDAFILNGCECEPYLTADHRAMIEWTDKILTGMLMMMKVLGVKRGYIGIEDNKPDAIEIMEAKVRQLGLDYSVISLRTKYPQGFEKMLIQAILNRKVPAGGLPMDVGVIVHNVGTAIAVAEAITEGKPLIQRIVTVTGNGINQPKNVLARIGTPFNHLIRYCNGLKEKTTQVFMGGPMTGIAQHDLNVPVVKATNGIICSSEAQVEKITIAPCIQCGSCVDACPMNLLPTRLARLTKMKQWETIEDLGIFFCMECGSCVFVCPSHIPLVQWIRIGKYRLNEIKRLQNSK